MIFTAQSGKRRDTGKAFAVLVLAMLSATTMVAQARPQKPIAAPSPEPTVACIKMPGEPSNGLYHWKCATCADVPILGLFCKTYDVLSAVNPENF